MKNKRAIELILLPKVFYTFKELKIKISILFSFLSKHWKLENKQNYLAYARTVGSWFLTNQGAHWVHFSLKLLNVVTVNKL